MPSPRDDDPEPVSRLAHRPELIERRGRYEGDSSFPERFVDWLTVFGERTGDVLVHSSAYLAVIAMAQVAIVMVLLSIRPNLAPIVVGLVTFAVYSFDRLADADTDAVSNPDQAAFVRANGNVLYVLASTAYGIAVALSVLGGPVALAITITPGAFWVLYASDWVPDVGVHFRRLKELLVVNSVVVALAWALTLTFLPLAFTGRAFTPAAAVIFVYFLLGTFVNAEIPNVRDMAGDRAIGVSTMPIVFGVRRTRQSLYAIDLVTIVLLAYAVAVGHVSSILAAALLVGLGYSLVVTGLLGRTEDVRLLTIAAESEYVVVALALVPLVYGV